MEIERKMESDQLCVIDVIYARIFYFTEDEGWVFIWANLAETMQQQASIIYKNYWYGLGSILETFYKIEENIISKNRVLNFQVNIHVYTY